MDRLYRGKCTEGLVKCKCSSNHNSVCINILTCSLVCFALVFPDQAPYQWLGSSFSFQCVVSGRLTDRGHLHGPLIVASAIFVTSIFLTGECKEYWQFMLCQGVAFGVRMFWSFCTATPISLAVVSWLPFRFFSSDRGALV